jgi:small subunit ribosomal protein S1
MNNNNQIDDSEAEDTQVSQEHEEETSEPNAEVEDTEAAPVAAAAPIKAEEEDEEEEEDEDEEEQPGKSFEELLDEYDKFRTYRPGDIVEGTVVSLGEQEVLIDISARVEGTIPSTELKDEAGNFVVTDGDRITVMVCRFNPDAQYIPLSFERARVSKVWDEIEELATANKTIQGTIIEKVKGGFIVDVGVRAFLPTSQATLKPQKDYQDLLGKKMEFAILKIQRRRGNLILSRRDLLQVEFESKKLGLFDKLKEGSVLEGAVKNITDYGVFIDLGGLDGLLHITDMSWGRVNHPKDLVELGQKLNVKVLRFDPDKEKVSLGLKQCSPDPWLSVAEKYPPNAGAVGKVLNLTSYGAFVELEPGVEGMIHVSELSWTKKVRNPGQVLAKGQDVQVRVLDLDTENRRVSLSLKQTEENPWESLAQRFPVGSRVSGKVRNITDFGAFVEIEDGVDGLVHISDFHWGERNATPSEYVKKGQEVEVVVLAVDIENHKVSLGIKQLENDPWIEFTRKYRANTTITAPIAKVTDAGLFLTLAPHVEGLVRSNELKLNTTPASYNVGDEVTVVITRITHRDRKVDLSMRRIEQNEERQAVMEYTRNANKGGATMGDIMGNELKKLLDT